MRILPQYPRAIYGIFISLSFFLLSCDDNGDPDPGLPEDLLEQAETRLEDHVDNGNIPGVATLVLQGSEIAHQFTYGMANIEESKPYDEHTIFRIYSMSKPITAAALMTLYDEGKFELDDPVENHIPILSDMKVWDDGNEVDMQEPFTIRQLLTHTAGFTYGFEYSYVDSIYISLRAQGVMENSTLEELVEIIADVPLKHQPGTTYEYSISIDIAGYLVEVLSGQTFDVFLEERIFGPLGMDDTGFMVEEQDYDRMAMIYGYGMLALPQMTDEVKKEPIMFSGGGGLVSTVNDYAKFTRMLLGGGELNEVRILEESTVDLIMSDHLPEAVDFDGGYGLGGAIDPGTGAYSWGGAASTRFAVYPEDNLVLLYFTQLFPNWQIPFEEYQSVVEEVFIP